MMNVYDAHLQFLIEGDKLIQANSQDVLIAILVYGEHLFYISHRSKVLNLVRTYPGVPYPAQIRQTAAAVHHLLKSRGPESVSSSFHSQSCLSNTN
jgi:hypothetical protein